MLAPRPAAGPALAFLQLLLGPANAGFSGDLLLGILDPVNELIAGQGRDVLPGSECGGVGDQCPALVYWLARRFLSRILTTPHGSPCETGNKIFL